MLNARLIVVEALQKCGNHWASAEDVISMTGLSSSCVYRHLRELRDWQVECRHRPNRRGDTVKKWRWIDLSNPISNFGTWRPTDTIEFAREQDEHARLSQSGQPEQA